MKITIDEAKALIYKAIDNFAEDAFKLGETFFQLPETGFDEVETEKQICAFLDKRQIPHQKNIALHGVTCSFSGTSPGVSPEYHIALTSDIDALIVQKDGHPLSFHSCGHSIQTVILLTLINAFYETKIMQNIPAEISFIFCPAEEFIEIEERKKMKEAGLIKALSGKQQMIIDGIFDDIDAVLSCHVMNPDPAKPELLFDAGASLSGFLHKRIEFRGLDSHAGVAAHEGRNALHAASLSLTAIQMLKDTFPPDANVKLYPILSEGGGTSVNVIPSYAVLETYLRAEDLPSLQNISKKLDVLFMSCSAALEIDCNITTTPGYLPFIQNKELVEIAATNIKTFLKCENLPACAFAYGETSGASGDHGDLSAILPVLQIGFSGIEGRVHSDDFRITNPKRAYIDSAKILTGTAIDILLDPQKQVRYTEKAERKKKYLKEWLAYNT